MFIAADTGASHSLLPCNPALLLASSGKEVSFSPSSPQQEQGANLQQEEQVVFFYTSSAAVIKHQDAHKAMMKNIKNIFDKCTAAFTELQTLVETLPLALEQIEATIVHSDGNVRTNC